jgi:hypothetical protein
VCVFLCGLGHLLRYHLGKAGTDFFYCNSILAAFISLVVALYLFPLIPNLFGIIDQTTRDCITQNEEFAESKAKLLRRIAHHCGKTHEPCRAQVQDNDC